MAEEALTTLAFPTDLEMRILSQEAPGGGPAEVRGLSIVAISEGKSPRVEIKEIREAISALATLERRLTSGSGPV
ncbi:MAG TPA: hypothetical protein VFJ30_10650 [Phycisphaerae bacterium]|nr:hypothetical protein [Phycisphaerae bacterium]